MHSVVSDIFQLDREFIPAKINAVFDLFPPGEGDSWRDELLDLAHSKQERTMSELRCLRQVQYIISVIPHKGGENRKCSQHAKKMNDQQ